MEKVRPLCSRSRGSYISCLLERLPRTSQTTVAFCRTLVVAHCGPTPMTCGSCSCREHITNFGDRSFSAAGPRPGLRRPGLTFDSFRQSLKTHLFGDQWLFWMYKISLSIYLSIYLTLGSRTAKEQNRSVEHLPKVVHCVMSRLVPSACCCGDRKSP